MADKAVRQMIHDAASGEWSLRSVHPELQPDIVVASGEETRRCIQCGNRSIYQYAGQALCRPHATAVQAAINKLRGPSYEWTCKQCLAHNWARYDTACGSCGCLR